MSSPASEHEPTRDELLAALRRERAEAKDREARQDPRRFERAVPPPKETR